MEQIPGLDKIAAASAIRSAKPACDPSSKIGFRAGGDDVHPAFYQAIDERADDFGSIHGFAIARTHVSREAIKILNLPIEEDDRDLGPCLAVNRRPAGTRLPRRTHRRARPRRPFACTGQSDANYTCRLLVAQTQQ